MTFISLEEASITKSLSFSIILINAINLLLAIGKEGTNLVTVFPGI